MELNLFQSIFLLLCTSALVLWISLSFNLFSAKLKGIDGLLKKQRIKRNGKIIWSKREFVTFSYEFKGHVIKASFFPGFHTKFSASHPQHTDITCKLQFSNNHNIAIHRVGIVQKSQKIIGAKDIRVDNLEFDKAFLIKSNSKAKVMQILSLDLQRNILNLKEVEPEILLSDKYLYLSINAVPGSQDFLEVILSTAEFFIEKVLELV